MPASAVKDRGQPRACPAAGQIRWRSRGPSSLPGSVTYLSSGACSEQINTFVLADDESSGNGLSNDAIKLAGRKSSAA